MRIGLVLFGHLRSYRQTLPSFDLLKQTLQLAGTVDIFCHTWDIEESVTASWWKEHQPGDKPSATVNAAEIEEKYHPVRYLIEPSRQFDDSGYDIPSSIPVAGILSMLHSQREAFRLLEEHSNENNVSYDVIIKTRYDLLYEIAPPFSKLVSQSVIDNCLFLPTSNPYELGGSFSDVFVIGPANLIRAYFSFADNFKNVVDSYQKKGYSTFLPEHCLTWYLQEKNINLGELDSLRIHILRLNGDKFQINTNKWFAANQPLCFFGETIKINKEFLNGNEEFIAASTKRLVEKYLSWIDKDADEEILQDYSLFYNGKWIRVGRIKRLASKAKNNSVFTPVVMKNFFEETMRNAKFGKLKKILLASILASFGGFGIFFFRVLKSVSISKSL
jgi:hypothetical protein